jgi:prepilin-type N-terminal cleavage/methylation domain-containing protein
MNSGLRRKQGVTLLEVLLVIAIGAAILLLSLNQYFVYRRDADVRQVQYNVNTLFQALGQYFRANCSVAGNPLNQVSSSTGYVGVTLAALKQQGFLPQNLPVSPLLSYTAPTTEGYVLQFNQVTSPYPQRTVTMSDGTTKPIGTLVLWQAQVAVNLKDPATASQYQQLLAADCLSHTFVSGSSNLVMPCSAVAGGTVAVWGRMPSSPGAEGNSTYWPTMPTVKQFTQMYTTDEILVLTDQTQTANQYFVCNN